VYDLVDLVLLVDVREGRAAVLCARLVALGVLCEVRALPLCDYLWVARPRGVQADPATEVVLGWGVERKTAADLAASALDGRWASQKVRMLRSATLTRRVLLVEGGLGTQDLLAPGALKEKLADAVVAGFVVVRTDCLEQTIAWAGRMHGVLRASALVTDATALQARPTYSAFSTECAAMRALTVGGVLHRMLRQLLSVPDKKAAGATATFPTFAALYDALEAAEAGSRVAGQGKKMSDTMREVFTSKSYD